MPIFSHLHSHTQYSLLDGASSIEGIMQKAKQDGMPAVALTDHGNMFGAFHFVNEANKQGIKPIVGCEFYVVRDRFEKSFKGGKRDKRYHQLLLAKDQKGYENLSKLCSLGFIDGLYSKFPRVDKDLIKQYSEGLIATSCCIGAEVPQAILNLGEEEAEKIFVEWHSIFGDDYYVEIQRHGLKNINGTGLSQEDVNQILIKFARKYNVPIIATNDSHYIEEEDWNMHDILLCVNTGETQKTPKGHGKGFRFGFENSEFYFKTQAEMNQLFADIPESIDNTNLIVDAITPPELKRDVLLPNYALPEGFQTQTDYLHHITYEGAKKRYGEITEEVRERIDYELAVINNSGYPGYFLIVQDFTTAARDMKVAVGPGRGSAAGSVVAYCLGITNVDPIHYNLLFERFLNPDRISLPDIDIDFDDEGRDKVIDYVIEKYGQKQVAQIITYGKMAAKSSLKDVGRVMDIPLPEVTKIVKQFPDKNNETGEMIRQAKKIEGSIRNTGVHACGVIITPDDMSKFVPLTVAKDSKMYLTQFDNNVVEDAGLLKMDFLGLRTLSIIKDAIKIIKYRHNIDIDVDQIPLDDEKTYELFQRGDTTAIFQYESPGMKKWLRLLKPTEFGDLIAMNALYRPGPMDYIQEFVDRKHGRKQITYDLPVMEEHLAETYGITVYQEQVMLLSQKLAGFTGGQADTLRKAMGKKKKDVLDKMYPEFVKGCKENGHPEDVVEKIWKDWEAFASYAFNKSHSTCYALIGLHTAYLKANYPAEFMASVLTHNMNDIKKVTQYMDEAKYVGVETLGPDVNESFKKFSVNDQGAIRFGLAAIKGVGEQAVESIVAERQENGNFTSIFDLSKRVDLKAVNKRTFENLVLSGAMDRFEEPRARYFETSPADQDNIITKAIRYGKTLQQEEDSAQQSLFGGEGLSIDIPEPKMPSVDEWKLIDKLNKERDVVGIFISGHPLDKFKLEVEQFTNTNLLSLDEMKDKQIQVAGLVSQIQERTTKKGDRYAKFTIEDFLGNYEIWLWSKDYAKYRYLINEGEILYIEGSYEPSWRDESEYQLKIKNISPIDTVVKEKTTALQLKLPYEKVEAGMVEKMLSLFDKNKGKIPLYIQLNNGKPTAGIKLYSRSNMVELSRPFLKELGELPHVEVELLKK